MHAPSGCPKWSSLDPELVADYSERFYACTQQCANPICRLSRYYDNVPGVVHPNRKYSGTITCESSLFGGAPGTIYNWKIGFQGGFELARISQDYGLNHWELGIGMAPWLRKCHEAGQLKTLDGEPFDLDQASCWDTLFRKIVFREGIGDALAEGTVRAAEILGMGQEFVADFYTAWGFAGHWDGHGDKINLIVFPYWLVPALQWATATRDPMASGHGYAQNIMNWSPMVAGLDGLGWEAIADVAANVYGTRAGRPSGVRLRGEGDPGDLARPPQHHQGQRHGGRSGVPAHLQQQDAGSFCPRRRWHAGTVIRVSHVPPRHRDGDRRS